MSETLQAKELPSPSPAPLKTPGLNGRSHLWQLKALRDLEEGGSAAAKAAIAAGRRYARHRRIELARLHGGEISAGVGTLIETAASLLACARYWMARSMSEDNVDSARIAAQLSAGARQAERDAWEIAAREASARRQLEKMEPQGLASILAQGVPELPTGTSRPARATRGLPRPASPLTPGGGVELGPLPPHTTSPPKPTLDTVTETPGPRLTGPDRGRSLVELAVESSLGLEPETAPSTQTDPADCGQPDPEPLPRGRPDPSEPNERLCRRCARAAGFGEAEVEAAFSRLAGTFDCARAGVGEYHGLTTSREQLARGAS